MEIDAELQESPQQLQDLIQREAKKLARSMIQKEVTVQVKHALKNTPGGQSKKAASPKKTRQKKGNGSNVRSARGAAAAGPAAAGTNSGTDTRSDDGSESNTSSRKMPTATITMTTFATIAIRSNRSNAIISSNSRPVEETTGQAHQTPLLVKRTADVELHACVPDHGTGAAMGGDRAIALRARRAKHRGCFLIFCRTVCLRQA
jgi:hypothetical protein